MPRHATKYLPEKVCTSGENFPFIRKHTNKLVKHFLNKNLSAKFYSHGIHYWISCFIFQQYRVQCTEACEKVHKKNLNFFSLISKCNKKVLIMSIYKKLRNFLYVSANWFVLILGIFVIGKFLSTVYLDLNA